MKMLAFYTITRIESTECEHMKRDCPEMDKTFAPQQIYPPKNLCGPGNIYPGPPGIYPGPVKTYPEPCGIHPGPCGIHPGPRGIYPGAYGIHSGPCGIYPGACGIRPGPPGIYPGPVPEDFPMVLQGKIRIKCTFEYKIKQGDRTCHFLQEKQWNTYWESQTWHFQPAGMTRN